MGYLHEIANFSVRKTFSLKKSVGLVRFIQGYLSANFRSSGSIFGQ